MGDARSCRTEPAATMRSRSKRDYLAELSIAAALLSAIDETLSAALWAASAALSSVFAAIAFDELSAAAESWSPWLSSAAAALSPALSTAAAWLVLLHAARLIRPAAAIT